MWRASLDINRKAKAWGRMERAVLFFDIGNTNTKIGVASPQGGMSSYVVPSGERQTADQLGLTMLNILAHLGLTLADVEACVGSSVVPGMSDLVRNACARYLQKGLLLAPEDIPIPLENRYPRQHEVGADRLVGAYGARRLFPDSPSIISVDFGTATTFDCVQGFSYLGGLICPGVLSSASALASQTAKLPQISLEVEGPDLLPCQSTVTSLNHGFVFGFAAMTEGLAGRLAKSLEGPVIVVGTGGFAQALARVTDCFDAVKPDLLLEGLRLLYKDYKRQHGGFVSQESFSETRTV